MAIVVQGLHAQTSIKGHETHKQKIFFFVLMAALAFFPGLTVNLIVATFPSNAPPPAVRRPFELVNKFDNSTRIFTVPTGQFSTIAACDDNVIHYFLHRRNLLIKCMWSSKQDLNTFDKALILAEIRSRYSHMANVALLISPTIDSIHQEDLDAWTMANCIGDDSVF